MLGLQPATLERRQEPSAPGGVRDWTGGGMPRWLKCLIALLALGFGLQILPALAAEPESRVAVTTTGMVADIVKRIGGSRLSVEELIGSGVDPHLYKPTRSDIARLASAGIVFYSGLLLEGKLSSALERLAEAGRPVHAVTELLDKSYLLMPPDFHGHPDPHVWMDPGAWAKTVDVVYEKLVQFDPEGEGYFLTNAETLRADLLALDTYANEVLSSVPAESRVLVTAHDAFRYFSRRYDFEVVGIQGISTDSEAGLQDIEGIVTLLVTRRIGAIFVESTVSDRNAQALMAGARARGQSVQIGGQLYSDAMGAPGTYEGTYTGMMDHNVTVIARALGGTAPERGMSGKLAIK